MIILSKTSIRLGIYQNVFETLFTDYLNKWLKRAVTPLFLFIYDLDMLFKLSGG